ncbi:MAG: DoxX family protein [Verrucomicrobiae bacterium]|nr:DoxX family protein [Verrucomicrobiae bacterium]
MKPFFQYAAFMTPGRAGLYADAGLLLLRLWLGLSMLLLHGVGKMQKLLAGGEIKFADPLGIGIRNSLMLAVFAETLCAAALIVGLATRLALTQLIATMAVAFFIVHKMQLAMGPGSGELAFIYLGGFLTLLVAGPGRFSLDFLVLNHYRKAT